MNITKLFSNLIQESNCLHNEAYFQKAEKRGPTRPGRFGCILQSHGHEHRATSTGTEHELKILPGLAQAGVRCPRLAKLLFRVLGSHGPTFMQGALLE